MKAKVKTTYYSQDDVLALYFYHDVHRFALRYGLMDTWLLELIARNSKVPKEQTFAKHERGAKVLEAARLVTVRVRSDGLDEVEKERLTVQSDWVRVDGGWCALKHVG